MSNKANVALTPIVLLALDCYRHPGLHLEILRGHSPLPEGVNVLLSFALKCQSELNNDEVDGRELLEASIFFIENVLLAKDASHYRILGLSHNADDSEIKSHHRLLIRLFHPDRVGNDDLWRLDFAPRINAAYNTLIHPELRRSYDQSIVVSSNVSEVKNSYRPSHKVQIHTMQEAVHPWRLSFYSFFLHRPAEVLLTITLVMAMFLIWLVFDDQHLIGIVDIGYSKSYLEVADELLTEPYAEGFGNLNASIMPSERFDPQVAVSKQTPFEKPAAETVTLLKEESSVLVDNIHKLMPTPENLVSNVKDKDSVVGGALEKLVRSSPAQFDKDGGTTSQEHGRSGAVIKQTRLNNPEDQGISSEILFVPVIDEIEVSKSPINHSGLALQQYRDGSQLPSREIRSEVISHASSTASAAEVSNDLDAVNVLMAGFVSSYEKGDLSSFMALFSPNAVTNGGGVDFIRDDYNGLFKSTLKRHLILTNMKWTFKDGVIHGRGHYMASVANSGDGENVVTKGRLIIEVSWFGTKPLISSINYTSE